MREMKDSGNMWIGATPETWKMIPLKYLASYNDEVLSENTDDEFEFDYANKIFDGQKHYEYRKRIPKKEVSKIVVYSSAPEQAVIGEIEVIKTLKMKPTPLWNSTKANAGISRSKYRKYFSGCTMAYAFVIGSFEKYPTSKSLADFNIQSAPQSFVYLDD